jgi:transposase
MVLMDNLGVHKSAEVGELIEARGCRLLFLPAHSRDFSAIENAVSKIKASLRKAAARKRAALEVASAPAIDTI